MPPPGLQIYFRPRMTLTFDLSHTNHTKRCDNIQTGRRMQVGYEKNAIFDQYLASSRVVNVATVRCYKHGAAGPWRVSDTHRWLAVSGGVCWSVIRGRRIDDEVFMTRWLNVTPRTTEQHLIVRTGKSEAEVNLKPNNRRVRSSLAVEV